MRVTRRKARDGKLGTPNLHNHRETAFSAYYHSHSDLLLEQLADVDGVANAGFALKIALVVCAVPELGAGSTALHPEWFVGGVVVDLHRAIVIFLPAAAGETVSSRFLLTPCRSDPDCGLAGWHGCQHV